MRTCDRCGLPGRVLNLVGGSLCHAEPGECIEALKKENERLQESAADKHQLYDIVCDEIERLRTDRNAAKWLLEETGKHHDRRVTELNDRVERLQKEAAENQLLIEEACRIKQAVDHLKTEIACGCSLLKSWNEFERRVNGE